MLNLKENTKVLFIAICLHCYCPSPHTNMLANDELDSWNLAPISFASPRFLTCHVHVDIIPFINGIIFKLHVIYYGHINRFFDLCKVTETIIKRYLIFKKRYSLLKILLHVLKNNLSTNKILFHVQSHRIRNLDCKWILPC